MTSLDLGPTNIYFIRYPKGIKGYYFYFADEQKVFVSNRTVFLEKEFLGEGTNASKVELDKVKEKSPFSCVGSSRFHQIWGGIN